MKIGVCSGYFDPLTIGHIHYLESAQEYCTLIIAIVNNNQQKKMKAGLYFMSETDRLEIVRSLKSVWFGIISIDYDDLSVNKTLEYLSSLFKNDELVFFNDGDIDDITKIREYDTCQRLGIEIKLLNNPKIASSSELLKAYCYDYGVKRYKEYY